jgi:hypothetical protein
MTDFCEHGNERFEALTAVLMKSTIFWDITPCIPLSVNRRLGGTNRLNLKGRKIKRWTKPARNQVTSLQVVSCSAIFFTLKMEAICSSETSVDTQRTTLRCIPEDGTLHDDERLDSIKSGKYVAHLRNDQLLTKDYANTTRTCIKQNTKGNIFLSRGLVPGQGFAPFKFDLAEQNISRSRKGLGSRRKQGNKPTKTRAGLLQWTDP